VSWETLYKKSLDHIKELNSVKNILLGYNIDIDLVKYVTQDFVDKKQIEKYYLKDKLKTMEDFFSGLFYSMELGKGFEVQINKELYKKFLNFSYDEERMGGQAGIMANLLSFFNIEKIIVYCGSMSKRQAMLFRDAENIFVPLIENNKLILKNPRESYEKTESMIHFIFEYKKGLKIKDSIVKRDNRFIASCPHRFPKNESLVFEKKFDYAILSGFHLLEKENFKEKLSESKKHIKKLRKNSNIKIHYEFTSMQNPEIRKYLVKDYLPYFDSLGLNKVELKSILDTLGYEDKNSIYENILRIKKRLKLKRVQFHELGYYLCVIDKEHSPENCRKALLFASLAAGMKAKNGDICSIEDIRKGLDIPISKIGYKKLKEFGDKKFVETGVFDEEDHFLIIVPTKVIENPKSTVGLGDVISCLSFIGT